MSRRLWRFVTTTALALLVPAVLVAQPVTLTVLHVNDTHSRLDAFGPKDPWLHGTLGGLAKAATVIKQAKAQAAAAGEGTLFLHAGDASVGEFYWNTYMAVPELKVLQSLGLDAMALGNHELDLGTKALTQVLLAAKPGGFPLLSANLDTAPCGDPANAAYGCAPLADLIQPHSVREVMGVRVGIVGATTPDDPVANQGVRPMTFLGGGAAVNRVLATASYLRQVELAQVVIVLSHLGLAYDKAMAASQPAPLVDFIVEGHDHDLFAEPLAIANASGHVTRIVSAGEFYKGVGRLRFEVDGLQVSFLDWQVLPVHRGTRPDPAVKAFVDSLKPAIVAKYGDVYKKPIAYAIWDVEKEWKPRHPQRDTGMGNLVADALRWKTKADVGLAAFGFISEKIYRGHVVGADVFRPIGYGWDVIGDSGKNYPLVVAQMTGLQLLQGIGLGVTALGQTDGLLMQVSGLRYRYDMGQPDPKLRLIPGSVYVHGMPVDLGKTYSVAANLMVVEIAKALLGQDIPYVPVGCTEYDAVHEWVDKLNVLKYRSENRILDVSVHRGWLSNRR